MENQKNKASNDEMSLKEMIQIAKDWWNYLLSKWVLILICGIVGAGLGVVYSIFKAPKYTAHLSFALIESDASLMGLADLASNFGIGGLIGGGGGAFSGDNLLEIIGSRQTVEQTLLRPVEFNGKQQTLANAYIEFSGFRKKWINNKKNPELKTLSYPIGQNRDSFTRTQDSILHFIYTSVSSPKMLNIARKNKKVSIVNVYFSSYNEKFAKIFIEKLIDETYTFYTLNKTMQSRANIDMLQHTADSIKALYDASLYKGASIAGINVNMALAKAAVPRLQQETNARLYGTVYTEVLKNMETLKLDLARKTPLVQIIDTPRFPLEKKRFGKLKGIIVGGFLGGILVLGFLIGKKYLADL